MPQEPVTIYLEETGEPCVMHSVDAAEAMRLGGYVSMPPEGALDKDGNATPEFAAARGRARARFMGGGLDQAELKSPEQRAEDTRKANEAEALRTAPPLAVVMAPQEAQKARTSMAAPKAEEPPKPSERQTASSRKDT